MYCLQLSLSKTLDYNDNDDAGSDPDFDTKDIEKVDTKKPKKIKKKLTVVVMLARNARRTIKVNRVVVLRMKKIKTNIKIVNL